MTKLAIQITQRPPKQVQLDSVKVSLQRKCMGLLIACAITGIIFIGLYLFDNPPTGKAARYAEARPVDWWMAGCIGVTLICGVMYTKLQFSIQLLQPITKEGAKTIKKLGLSQPKIAWYINQVDKEGRPIIEAEAKTCQLFASGHSNHVEKF